MEGSKKYCGLFRIQDKQDFMNDCLWENKRKGGAMDDSQVSGSTNMDGLRYLTLKQKIEELLQGGK